MNALTYLRLAVHLVLWLEGREEDVSNSTGSKALLPARPTFPPYIVGRLLGRSEVAQAFRLVLRITVAPPGSAFNLGELERVLAVSPE